MPQLSAWPRLRRAIAPLVLAPLTSACVYVPRTTQVFDPDCQISANRMVLQEVQVAAIHHCANEGCIALVVTAGLATAVSVVISGSIVVAGNVAYWFERRAGCDPVAPR